LHLLRTPEDVIYVHGLWLTGHESLLLRGRLEREHGFRTHTFHYGPVSAGMGEITDRLHAFVNALRPRGLLHFVGHSLGGLVIYRFLERFMDPPPGRVVFLGTPAVACKAAHGAARYRLPARLIGRCVAEELLAEHQRRWAYERELGIIAGNRRMGLGQFFAGFNEECDGTVAVSETRLPGATDHVVLPVSHMGMLVSPRVARQTGEFLRSGHFALRDGPG
jgi:pimeloyl-ACP methyl ester carboxylesterase